MLSLLSLLAACGSTVDPGTSAHGSVLVANASNGWIDVHIDGELRFTGLSMNAMTYLLTVPRGLHQVRLSRGGVFGAAIEIGVNVSPESQQTIVAFPSFPTSTTPDISAAVLADTGAYVPGGKSKLRVAHFAATAGDVQIWRRQPDFPSGTPIMTPFPYRAVSPYLQSDAGVWEVWLTPPDASTKLLSSGPIQIPSGERRTVLLVDTEEGPRVVVMGL
jgi:hypothetical protein